MRVQRHTQKKIMTKALSRRDRTHYLEDKGLKVCSEKNSVKSTI
jgi:hypothetical protein